MKKIDENKHYVWQERLREYTNIAGAFLRYYYIFSPLASLSIIDYDKATKEIKERPTYNRWLVYIDTDEMIGYDETVSHYLKVKGDTVEEVKAESLELFKEYARDQSAKFIGLEEKLEDMS